MNGLRTVVTTIAGLVFLLLLAYLDGTLSLPAELVGNLAYAGMGMVLGVAGKGSVEHWAKRPTGGV